MPVTPRLFFVFKVSIQLVPLFEFSQSALNGYYLYCRDNLLVADRNAVSSLHSSTQENNVWEP